MDNEGYASQGSFVGTIGHDGGATYLGDWYCNHLDHQLPTLMGPDGTLRACETDHWAVTTATPSTPTSPPASRPRTTASGRRPRQLPGSRLRRRLHSTQVATEYTYATAQVQ